MSHRIDLTAELERSRAPIDAGWSRRKRLAVGAGAIAASSLAVSLGALFMARAQPPALPKSFDEAVKVIASGALDRMDESRRQAYLEEAARLLRDQGRFDWPSRAQDDATRSALRTIREQRLDDAARRFARGEDPFAEWRNRDRPQMTPEQREQMRQRFAQARDQMTPEELAERREQMRRQINEQATQALATGNAQDGALRSEMAKRLGAAGGRGGRGGFGGFRGGGGR